MSNTQRKIKMRLIISLLFVLIIAMPSDAGYYYGKADPLDCSEYFPAGDTGDVDGNSNFDSETDPGSDLAIVSNAMQLECDGAADEYVIESDCIADSDTEQTIKFKIRFSDITDVDAAGGTFYTLDLRDDAALQRQARFRFSTDGSRDISTYEVVLYKQGLATENSSSVTMTGLAANTWYDVVCYYKFDASAGGASMKVGAWAATDTGFNDDNDDAGNNLTGSGQHRLGAAGSAWGDSRSFTIDWDDYEVYKSDQR